MSLEQRLARAKHLKESEWVQETHRTCTYCDTHFYGSVEAGYCRLEEEWLDFVDDTACCGWRAR